MNSRKRSQLAVSALLLGLFSVSTQAAITTWTGGGTDNYWATPLNWNTPLEPDFGDDLLFPASPRTTITNNLGSWLAGSLTFPENTDSYVLRGDSLMLSGGITNAKAGAAISLDVALELNDDSTVDVISNGSVTINKQVSGSFGLTKTGGGQLTLNATNTFHGNVVVAQGIIVAGKGPALGSTNGFTVVSNGATLDVNGQELGAELVFVGGAGVAEQGAIINSGAQQIRALRLVTLTGDTVLGGTGRWDIRGAGATLSTSNNPYNLVKTGTNQISLVGVSVDSALGNIDIQQGTFAIQLAVGPVGSAAHSITIRSNAALNLFNNDAVPLNKSVTMDSGSFLIHQFGSSSISGSLAIDGDCTLDVAGGFLTLSNGITGNGVLHKRGDGTLTLTSPGVYTGETRISGGTLKLIGQASLSSALITLTNSPIIDVAARNDGTLTLAPGQSLAGPGVIHGSLIVSPGATISVGPNVGVLTASNTVTLQGTTALKLDKGNATNDVVSGMAIQFGGTLDLSTINGSFPPGSSYVFKVFDAAAYSGVFTNIVPATPGPSLMWFTNHLTVNGTIQVIHGDPGPEPTITNAVLSGTNFVISGKGVPFATYYVRSTTNLTLPRVNWDRIATNVIAENGSLQCTNPVLFEHPFRFYTLEMEIP